MTSPKISKVGIAFCVIGALVLLLLVPSFLRLLASSNSSNGGTPATTRQTGDNTNSGAGQYQYSVNEANAIVEKDQKYKNDGTSTHPSTFDAIKLIKLKDTMSAYSLEESSFTWMGQDQNDSSYTQGCIMILNGSGDIMDSHTRERILSEELFNFKNNGSWYIDKVILMKGYYNNCPAGGSAPVSTQDSNVEIVT